MDALDRVTAAIAEVDADLAVVRRAERELPAGVRPCCGTPWWPDRESPHLASCREWGTAPLIYTPGYGWNVWWDVPQWSTAD